MHFDAIVHAPSLRVGARLNIAEADQVEGMRPAELAAGAEIRLRFGVCCPNRSHGQIVAVSPQKDTAVLAVGTETWDLRRCAMGGVSIPGLVSDTWYVANSATPGASPTEHSFTQSSKSAVAQG